MSIVNLPVAILTISDGVVSVLPVPNVSLQENEIEMVRAVTQAWLRDTFVPTQIGACADDEAAERIARVFGGTVAKQGGNDDTENESYCTA